MTGPSVSSFIAGDTNFIGQAGARAAKWLDTEGNPFCLGVKLDRVRITLT